MEDKVVATRLGMWRSWFCRLGPRLRRLVCRESERESVGVYAWVCVCVCTYSSRDVWVCTYSSSGS